jgi:hypothetical protein
MASAFNLTAQINLRGPTNLKPIVSQIRRELGSVNSDISLKIDSKAIKSIDSATARLGAMNKVLINVKNNTSSLNQSLRDLSSSLGTVQTSSTSAATGVKKTSENVAKVAKNISVARTEMEEFGKQSALAIRRFAAFSVVTTGIFALTNAITGAFRAFIDFDKELVRLQQVTGRGAIGIKILQDEITNLSTTLGVSSASLTEVASTLAQAGLNIEETRVALKALAKTELAPSFENLTKTTEGAIAAIRQFGLEAGELEGALGSINAVAAAFAVESGDIIAAIQRTGGVFASASKGVSEGTDALNEFVAVFTSIRQTTRESAETIATGLRTIFTRIQRESTIKALKTLGVELRDTEGQFVGAFEAVRRLSEGLNKIDPRSREFAAISEELGGFRQIGKVIPLIQQFSVAQQALGVAQRGQSSLTDAQVKAQQSLANQIAKVREQFLALIREIGQSSVFQGLFKIVLGLTSGLISLAGAFKPILPILAVVGAIKGVSAIGQFATGFFGGLKKGGGAGGAGQNIGETISGAKEKQRAEVTAKAADAIRLNTDALKSLTSAVQSLDNTIRSRGTSTLASGGKVLGFQTGGVVPGSGRGDKVPAMLEPGEVVMNRKAVQKYGTNNLLKMNGYKLGGSISLSGDKISKTYASLKNKAKPDVEYVANIKPIAQSTKSIKPRMEKVRQLNPGYPNWKLFEYAVGERYGLRVAGGNKFLDFPSVLGEAKFMQPDGTYAQDKETGFIKGNNNETMLAKLVGADKYRKNATVRAYYPENINDFRNFVFGGRVQSFEGGSPGGIRVQSGKGRGKTGARGARDTFEPISTETYLKWAKGIYEDYDADESLPMTTFMGVKMPPEIAYANYLLGQYVFEKGGAGLAVGKRFVRTPKANITDELKPYLAPDPSDPNEFGFFEDDIRKFGRTQTLSKAATAKLGKQSALEAAAARNATYTNAESAISSFKETGNLDVDPAIMGYLMESIANPDNLPLEPKELDKLKKKLTKPNLDAFSALVGPDKTPVGVQGQRTKLSEVFGTILETYDGDTSDLEIDNIIRGVGSKIQDKKLGGIIQKFMSGSIRGVQPLNEEILTPQELYEWVQSLGTAQEVRGLAGGNNFIDQKLKGVISTKPATSKEIFTKNFLLGGQSDSYLAAVQELLTIADSNKKKPRIFTDEEKANATKVGLVGMLPFGVDQLLYDQIGDKIVAIQMKSLTQDKAVIVDQMRKDIDTVLGKGTQALYGDPGKELDNPTKEALGLGNLEGYMIEAILARAGANPGKLNDRSVDYASGLGSAASLFGIDPNIPTEVKRDVKGGLSKARANFRNYFAKLSFGGKADGPGFEEIKQQIIDKYPEIQFRISKRKRAFGYNLMGALKSKGGLSGDSGLNFQQPGNLKQLQAYSDKLAAKLMNPEQLAAGGLLAEPVQSTSSQTQKNFGKVALRTGNRIQATYIKEGEAAAARSGQVIADSIGGGLYAVQSSSATKGYGPKLYDIVMEAATAAGGMLTSDRRTVSDAAKSVWAYYFNNRSDVKKTPLNPENWVSNSRLLDEKLYGPPDTWPSATDPAWILQTGYSKAPSDINNTSLVVQRLAGGGSTNTVPAMVSNGEAFVPPKVAKKIGYAKLDKMNQADRNGMKGFAGGGISVFNGPGSGTSDSIGPIGLPTGSYVIREKATKALGLNKGGSVGVRKFFKGGQNKKDAKRAQGEILQDVEQAGAVLAQIMAQLPDQIREVLLKKFKGLKDLEPGETLMGGTPAFTENTRGQAASSESAAAIGLKITGKKGGATTETVAHETGHLADFELGGGKAASEIEGTFQFELVAKIKKQMEEAFIAAGESSNRINDYLLRGKELFAEFFAKASPEVRAIITSTTDAKTGMAELAKTLGETGYTYAGLEASDIDTSASTPKPQPPLPIIPPSGLPPAPPSGPSFVFPPSPPDPPDDKQKKPKPQQEGRLSKEERKKRKEAYTAKSREGGLTREEARAVGVVREDFGGSSTIDPVSSKVLKYREESAQKQEKAALDELKAATEAQDAAKKQLEEAKKRKQNLGKSSTQTERQTAKDAVKAAETQLGETQSRKSQATNKVAEARQKAVDVEEAKKAATVSTNTPDANKEKAKSDLQKTADQEVADAMEQVRKNVTQKYQDILQTEVDNIRAFYATRIAAAGKNSKEEADLIQQQRSAIADTKASIEAAQTGEIKTEQAKVPEQIATSKRQQVEQLRETKARAADPFYDAKKAANASAAGMPGMPKVNPKIAEERKQYLQFKAEQSGMTAGGYKYSMAQKLGAAQFNVERETTLARTETRAVATGRRRELEGINVKKSLEADTQEGRRVQSIVDEFASNLQKADPSLGAGKARDAAIALAEGLSDGTKSVEEIIKSNETLKTTLDGNIDSSKVMEEAFRRTALEMGESVENLKANVSNKQIQQQAFIKSTEGQRFGALAEFAPGLTQRLSQTRGGKALGAGADFISGKGGRFSKTFAGAGGFTGIGAGLAVGAETLKQFLPKSVTSDPNTAGALGAIGGAGTGAAMGAQLGSIAGPIGSLVGGVGGAIIGGIQGFFNAKNQAILTNAVENVAKTTGQLGIAFKKLEADANAVNLGNAQKAFGELLGAQQDIRQMAFTAPTLTGTDAATIGGTAVAGAATGAGIGALLGSVVPLLGTAVGAAIGGVIGGIGTAAYSYFNRPSSAQREEALGTTIQQSGANQEAATRLAEGQLRMTSTEDIDNILKGLNDGVTSLNPVVQQYATSMAASTDQTVEQVMAQAEEQAALDAFMKLRKEAGATDEQIGKELEKNRGNALKVGKESLQANAQLLLKQQLLARATKEVAIATESLLDVYRRINAQAEKYGSELEQFGADVDALVGGLGGDTSMRAVNRQNEQILGNISAYSTDEVRTAANATAGLLGGTPEAQNLANQAVAQKVIQDQVPALLRNATDAESQSAAMDQIRTLLEEQGLGGGAVQTVLDDLGTKLAEGAKSETGTSEQDLQDQIQKSFATVGKGLEALQNVTKKYNDTLQQARKFQADYNKAILEAGSYLRKATQVRLNAELDLAKALGRSPSLEELNRPFDTEVSSLTSGLVQTGNLDPNAASDPVAIAAAISSAERKKQAIEQGAPGLVGAAANIPGGAAGDPLRQELNKAQLDNIKAVGELTVASAEGRQALEKLANDGSKAANALAKIQEEQQALEGFGNFAQKVFTAEPQQLAQMEMQAVALNAAQTSGPEFFKSRFNRQQAFAGLEQEREFMTNDEFKQTRASLVRKSFEAQGFKGTDVVKQIAGKDVTLDELEKRLAGGVDETDPNVVKFREAAEIQAKANEALGKLNLEQATVIQNSMLQLEFFLGEKFPNILTDAVIKAREDAQVRPEVKPETKPREPSEAEKNVARGEELVKSGKERVAAADKEYEALPWYSRGSENVGRINTQRMKAQEDIRTGTSLINTNKPIAEKDKAVRTMEASIEASRRSLEETENKARQTEENKAKAEESIRKAKETREGPRPTMVGAAAAPVRTQEEVRTLANAVLASTPTAPIQAPPAPGTTKETQTGGQEIDTQTKIKNLESMKQFREKEIQQRSNMLTTKRIAASAAGTLKEDGKVVNPGVIQAQEWLASSQEALVLIEQQIASEKQRLAALAEQAKLEAQGQGPLAPSAIVNATVPTTPQDPNALRLPQTAPVPVTMPQQASYTNQQATTQTPQDQRAIQAQTLVIDQTSIEALNNFNLTFGSYVDKLVSFEFPTIPDVIEMKGNHVVDVRISGAAAFEGLKKDFNNMMQAEIKKAMGKIWGQSGGQMGERPSGTETPP